MDRLRRIETWQTSQPIPFAHRQAISDVKIEVLRPLLIIVVSSGKNVVVQELNFIVQVHSYQRALPSTAQKIKTLFGKERRSPVKEDQVQLECTVRIHKASDRRGDDGGITGSTCIFSQRRIQVQGYDLANVLKFGYEIVGFPHYIRDEEHFTEGSLQFGRRNG